MILYLSKFSEMIAEMSDEIHKYIRKCIVSASFDKSKSARITQVLDNNEYVVTMSDGAVKTVPSLSSDSFNVNDVVRVTVAQNDSKNCYIIGKPNISKGSSSGAVDSVNGQTGVVLLDADDISDAGTTNKFVTFAEKTKLSNLSGVNTGDQNLYSIGGSNRNLLGNGSLTVNQRGLGTYTGNGYTLDRWKLMDSGGISTVTVTDDTVIFSVPSSSPDQAWFAQYGERDFDGSTYTASINAINVAGGVILYAGTNLVGVQITSSGITSISGILTGNLLTLIAIQPGGSITLPRKKTAIKLELGSVSTLANDPPADYGEELRNCQRYYEVIQNWVTHPNTDKTFEITVPFKVTKRIAPSVVVKSPNGTVGALGYWTGSEYVDFALSNNGESNLDRYRIAGSMLQIDTVATCLTVYASADL